jgi:hypothetical protein
MQGLAAVGLYPTSLRKLRGRQGSSISARLSNMYTDAKAAERKNNIMKETVFFIRSNNYAEKQKLILTL